MKIEKENVKEDFMIDTFLTWEELCMAASFIENIKLFEKKMLNSILKKCYLEIITQNC
ncbi:hypothetical protein [Ruminococcus sp. YE71]|uniref:hypothetical protein n=2 Tax=unclassified Ruminococcus TaxID=2608920 RepID=UPI0015877EC3|nr:hypothetical protein [Ruminococcus sp. YE71]